MKLNDVPAPLWWMAGLAVAGVVAWKLFPKLAQAINPVNPNNVFASSANAVGAAISGDESFSVGGGIYSLTHWGNPLDASPNWTPESWARHVRLTGGEG